jgi:hypothetical protein
MVSWSNDESSIVDILNDTENLFKEDKLIYEGKTYSSYDAHNKNYTCEIKKRTFESYHKYAQEGLILEKKKYIKLLEKAKLTNTQALYINLFTDNKFFIWNLTELTNKQFDFKWHQMKMNKATFQSKYNKVEKEVTLLKKEISIYE